MTKCARTHTHTRTHAPLWWRARIENGEDLCILGQQGSFITVLQNLALDAGNFMQCSGMYFSLWFTILLLLMQTYLWLGSTGILHASQRWFPLPFWSRNCHSGHVPYTTNIQECKYCNILSVFCFFFFPFQWKIGLRHRPKKTKVCRKSGTISR